MSPSSTSTSTSTSSSESPIAIGFGANYYHNFGSASPESLPHNNATDFEWVDAHTFMEGDTPWEKNDDSLVQVACSSASSFFLTRSGKIYTCGTLHGLVRRTVMPVTVRLPLKCVELAAGRHFGLARMEGGLAVCAWGAGHFGQLGLGSESAPFLEHPTVIEALLPHVVGAPVSSIAAGYWHAMAVTQAGQLFSWGCNRNSQCGMKPQRDPPTVCAPQLVRFEPTTKVPKIRKIAAGRSHSVALDSDGAVYCWGACQHAQCGFLSRRRGGTAPPKHVEALSQVRIVDIAAGDSHTLALTGGGRVFGWGGGFEGQLGQGAIIQLHPKPKLVSDLDFVSIEASQEWRIKQAIKNQQQQQQQQQQQKQQEQQQEGQQPKQQKPQGGAQAYNVYKEPLPMPSAREFSTTPTPALPPQNSLANIPKIVSIHASGNVSVARSSAGHVYAWGCNDVGNLGVPKQDTESLIYAEPGLPAASKNSERKFHTQSFDSSHNIALPQRLDALNHLRITSVAVSPTFTWCLGVQRTDDRSNPATSGATNSVGRTLYEVEEAKRHKSQQSKLRPSTVANVLHVKEVTQSIQSQSPADGKASAKADPPEVIEGSQVSGKGKGYKLNGGRRGSTGKSRTQGKSGGANDNLVSPSGKGKKRFSIKKFAKMARASVSSKVDTAENRSSNSIEVDDDDNDYENNDNVGFFKDSKGSRATATARDSAKDGQRKSPKEGQTPPGKEGHRAGLKKAVSERPPKEKKNFITSGANKKLNKLYRRASTGTATRSLNESDGDQSSTVASSVTASVSAPNEKSSSQPRDGKDNKSNSLVGNVSKLTKKIYRRSSTPAAKNHVSNGAASSSVRRNSLGGKDNPKQKVPVARRSGQTPS